MKRLALILTLLLAGPVAAQTPPPAVIVTAATVPDCTIHRGQLELGFRAALGGANATARAQAVAMAFAKALPGDVITVTNGTYDFSAAQLVFPAGVTVRGMGREATKFTSSWFDWGSGTRIAFALSNGSVVEDLSMSQATSDPTVDGICCGFPAGNISATLRRVAIQGREWGLYSWYPGCVLDASDCTITAGRVCVASEDSGNGQTFTLSHCRIIGDASLSSCTTNYDVSNPRNGGIFGVVHRGGPMTLTDCRIDIKGAPATGQPQLPRAVAITDTGGDNSAPAGNTKLTLDNVRTHVDPGGATSWYDVDLEYGYTQAAFGQKYSHGSESDGTLKRSW